jgi:hypothetical protein
MSELTKMTEMINVLSPIQSSGKLEILKKGPVLFRTSWAPQECYDVNVITQVAFGEPRIIRGNPAVPFLQQLSHLVSSIVDGFAPLL